MDQWLENLKKVATATPQPVSAKPEPNVESQFRDLVAIDTGDSLSGNEIMPVYVGDPVASDVENPVKAMIAKFQQDRGASGVQDFSWDAPMTKTVASDFPARSKERFEKVCAVIKRIFGDSEEYNEAVAIAQRAFDEERAAILLAER